MKSLSRVVWSEGMYLGPHHFQAQSRYFEDSIQFATSALWFDTYGVVGCKLSAEALRNGVVAVMHAGGMAMLPIARIKRSGAGYFIFDPEFIPPCLQIIASERILSVLSRLIETLEEKGASLAVPKRDGAKASFSTREIANFWFLHTVNSSLAPLRHLYASKRGHPEALYLKML